jgi:uncharacterized protein YggE
MEEITVKFLKKTFMLVSILVVVLILFLFELMGYQQKMLDQQNQNQITVSGEGKVYAKPDVAIVSLGVTVQGKTVADVTKLGTDKMNAVIAVIKALKIDEKDIQTTNYSLTPTYENSVTPVASMMYPSGTVTNSSILSGYSLDQNVQVKIRDFTKIGDVLSQATASGANLVGDLQFTIDNPEQFKEQARATAIKDAKTNAQNLAKESGINLGKIINVYEGYNSSPVMYDSAKVMSAGASSSAPVPTIQPGQQEVDVTINLTYKVN